VCFLPSRLALAFSTFCHHDSEQSHACMHAYAGYSSYCAGNTLSHISHRMHPMGNAGSLFMGGCLVLVFSWGGLFLRVVTVYCDPD
jgi:hypothetical protein